MDKLERLREEYKFLENRATLYKDLIADGKREGNPFVVKKYKRALAYICKEKSLVRDKIRMEELRTSVPNLFTKV